MLLATRRRTASRLAPLLVALYLLGILCPCSVAAADNSSHCASISSEFKAASEWTEAITSDADKGGVVDDEVAVRGCCKVMCAQMIPVSPLDSTVEIRPSIEPNPYVESDIVSVSPKRLIRPPIFTASL